MRALSLSCLLLTLAAVPAVVSQQIPESGEELTLRRDSGWTGLVVVLRDGKRVTFNRSEISKLLYLTNGTRAGVGRIWHVEQIGGRTYKGTFTRRGNSRIYDAHWTSGNQSVSDELEQQIDPGNKVTFIRKNERGKYFGSISPDGTKLTNGTSTWSGVTWTATIK
jgi:hypothetical protein